MSKLASSNGDAVEPRRRPRDRKAQIRSAAGELFLERGYHNVSVTDVADALDVAPSALYHHYRDKLDLLLHAVLHALDSVDLLVLEAADLEDALASLAALAVGPRSVLAVWEREARNLDVTRREAITAREGEIIAHLARLIQDARPDTAPSDGQLLARAVLGVLGSRSRHRVSLPRRREEQLMLRLAQIEARCRFSDRAARLLDIEQVAVPTAPSGLRPSRREVLLTEAVRLFDERGYQAVTMADIGEAAGVVASGVYRHFSSKTDLLTAAANRGSDRMWAAIDAAVGPERGPLETLEHLLRAHIQVSVDQQHLVGILVAEAGHLPDAERAVLRRFQADYLKIWLQALRAETGDGPDATELKIVIHAVQSMIYYAVRTAREEHGPDFMQKLFEVGMPLLLEGTTPQP